MLRLIEQTNKQQQQPLMATLSASVKSCFAHSVCRERYQMESCVFTQNTAPFLEALYISLPDCLIGQKICVQGQLLLLQLTGEKSEKEEEEVRKSIH